MLILSPMSAADLHLIPAPLGRTGEASRHRTMSARRNCVSRPGLGDGSKRNRRGRRRHESKPCRFSRCAPYAPQSIGMAGKVVSTLKNSLEQAEPTELDKAVAAHKYTPNAALDGRPSATVFFGRTIRISFAVFRWFMDKAPNAV